MIRSIFALFAIFGFGIGDAERPVASIGIGDAERPVTSIGIGDAERPVQLAALQIIKAIDSSELEGLNVLETHDADEWYV